MKTFKEFTDTLRSEIWPSGEQRPLKIAHTKQFMAALTDLQKNIPCLQVYNATTFAKCSRYWEDGATIVPVPNGIISRVFTIANGEWRDKVLLWPDNYVNLQRWQKRLFGAVTPANTGLPALPQGFRFDDGTIDSVNGRARVGIWTIYRHRVYVAPWLQGNETLVIEWDGVKDSWVDGDGINEEWWTTDVQEAVKDYVRWKHEKDYGELGVARAFEASYIQKRADLMVDCWDRTREQEKKEIPEAVEFLTSTQLTDDVAPTVTTSFRTCVIADWDDNADTDLVVAQIKAQNPSAVFTAGDNAYGGVGDAVVGGGDPAVQYVKFDPIPLYPAFGNHDWAWGSQDLSEILALVTLPNNERYYEVIVGPVHYFILSTDPAEPDGGYVNANTSTQTSIMGVWLQVRLAISTAKWKVVIGHHTPFSSDVNYTPGLRYMRWPLKTWGADLGIFGHGHNFEDVLGADGLHYLTIGIGGHSLRAFGANTTGTILKQYNSSFGFLRLDSTCDKLTPTLVDVNGNDVYSFDLTK